MHETNTSYHAKLTHHSATPISGKIDARTSIFSLQGSFQLISQHGPCLRLPAQHPSTGDLGIWIEDNEITLVIELITHCHFTCPYYLLNASVEEQAQAILPNRQQAMSWMYSWNGSYLKWSGRELG